MPHSRRPTNIPRTKYTFHTKVSFSPQHASGGNSAPICFFFSMGFCPAAYLQRRFPNPNKPFSLKVRLLAPQQACGDVAYPKWTFSLKVGCPAVGLPQRWKKHKHTNKLACFDDIIRKHHHDAQDIINKKYCRAPIVHFLLYFWIQWTLNGPTPLAQTFW